MKRFGAWLLPGLAISASISLATGALAYNWRNPHLTEIQVLQALPEWWATCWPLGIGLLAVYGVWSLCITESRP